MITLFVSYKVDSYRDKKKDEKRLKFVVKTVASEIHAHKEYIEALLSGDEMLKDRNVKLSDNQWEKNQKDIWELDPSIGVIFRKYYDELNKMKNKQFTHDSDLGLEFAPLLKLAKECLNKADFPYRNVRVKL